jgi:hypothetical protein
MPTDVDAILAYGYDLGGPGRWNLRGADSDLEPSFSWWDGDDDDSDSFSEAAHEKLRQFRRTNVHADVAGVEVVWYGSDTRHGIGIGYILAAAGYHSYYSNALPLTALRVTDTGDWDRRLGNALDILGIQPQQVGPRWLLAASHGI